MALSRPMPHSAGIAQHGAARTGATRLTYDDEPGRRRDRRTDRRAACPADDAHARRRAVGLDRPAPGDGVRRLHALQQAIGSRTRSSSTRRTTRRTRGRSSSTGSSGTCSPTPRTTPTALNNLVIAGHTNIFQTCSGTGCGEYVVQPPLGKLLMAVGEWLFGLTTLGWRVAPALIGTLAVLVMCRVARRLTRSTLLGCTAGLLLSLDGLEFVLSRTGILDIFLMFFVLAAFGALVVDRDVSRGRLAEAMVLQPGDDGGPGARDQEVARHRRASSSASPARPSSTASGTSSPSPGCASPGTSARAVPSGCAATCAARWCGTASGCRSPSA